MVFLQEYPTLLVRIGYRLYHYSNCRTSGHIFRPRRKFSVNTLLATPAHMVLYSAILHRRHENIPYLFRHHALQQHHRPDATGICAGNRIHIGFGCQGTYFVRFHHTYHPTPYVRGNVPPRPVRTVGPANCDKIHV